jgi:diphthamide biosynthesis methyltransferase
MPTYSVTLTDAEDKAIHHVAISAQDWIENVVKERCRTAIEKIVNDHVATQLAAGQPLAGTTHEEIVVKSNVKSMVQITAENDAAQQEILNSMRQQNS